MKKYNFYGALNVVTHFDNHRGYTRYFDNEYKRIISNSDTVEAPTTIHVKLVKQLPAQQENDIARKVFYKKLFHYSFLVRGVDSNEVTIYFKRHYMDRIYMNAIGVFLQAQVLEPIMYLKLLENDVVFLHAGGVSKDNNGYLMAAHGGTGKTTFSIALLNNGFKLLGDDLLFVNTKARKVYPYPRPMHIFTYNIHNLKGARIPLKYWIIIYTKNVIRFVFEKLLKVEFLISTRIHADEVFESDIFSSTVPYKAIFFLRKDGPASEKVSLNSRNYGSVAEQIMISADLNDSLYDIFAGKESAIKSIKQTEKDNLIKLLQQFPDITYINTRKLDLNNLQPFISETFPK